MNNSIEEIGSQPNRIESSARSICIKYAFNFHSLWRVEKTFILYIKILRDIYK